MVGVNKYVEKEEQPINILRISKKAQSNQIARLNQVLSSRDSKKVDKCLADLERAMENDEENLMPFFIRAVESYCTLQEISDVGRKVFGGWKEPVIV